MSSREMPAVRPRDTIPSPPPMSGVREWFVLDDDRLDERDDDTIIDRRPSVFTIDEDA